MGFGLLSPSTKAVLAERQREVRRLPPSLDSGGKIIRYDLSKYRFPPRDQTIYRDQEGRLVTRGTGDFVGNPNMVGIQAGWTIVKGDTPSQMQQNGINARLIGYERHPVVNACIRLVSDLVAAVPFEVYKKVPPATGKHRFTGDDVQLMPDSPAQKVLDTPYFSMSPFRMRRLLTDHFNIYGNWFCAMIRDGEPAAKQVGDEKPLEGKGSIGVMDGNAMDGLPQMLRPVHPERLLYVYLDAITEEPILYDWRDRYGYRHRTPAVNMLHCADSTCTDWIFGYPRAAAALLDIGTDNEASAYVRQVVHNDGAAGTVFLLEEMISDEQAQQAKERFYQRNVERGQRGRASFMSGVKDVKPFGASLKDLEFPNLRQVAREDICAVFGVDPRMVGVASATGSREGGLSGKQFLEARYRLIQQTVIPIMRMVEAYLDTWFMPEFGANMYVRFSREGLSALTEDETETWQRTTAAFAASLLTREEARSYIGQPDKPEPTDTWFVPTLGQLVPVANEFDAVEQAAEMADARVQAVKNPPQLGAGTGEGDQGKPARGAGKEEPNAGGEENEKNAGAGGAGASDTSGKKPANKRRLAAGVITSTPGSPSGGEVLQPLQQRSRALLRYTATSVVARGVALSSDARRAAWEVANAKAESHEPKFQHAASTQLARDGEACDRAIRGSAKRATSASIPDDEYAEAVRNIRSLFSRNDGQLTLEWTALVTPIIRDTMHAGAKGLSDAIGVDWSLKNPQVGRAITRRAQALADFVGETTGELCTAALRVAWQAGLSIDRAADLIRDAVFSDDMTATRAQRIARTESIGALNEGEHTAAQMSGVVEQKEWLTQGDERVRDSHAELDGVTVDLDDSFANGCDYPGDPNGDAEEVINCRCTLLYHTTADRDDAPGDVDPDAPWVGDSRNAP